MRAASSGLGFKLGQIHREGAKDAKDIENSNCSASPHLGGEKTLMNHYHFKEVLMADHCIFCNSTAYGSCSRSPHGRHQHLGDEKHCVFCGASAYGSCPRSPHGRHQHGHGGNKCVYCGSTATGSCSHSPHGRHEK